MLIASDSDGAGRLFPPDAPSAASYLGAQGFEVINTLRARVDEHIAAQYGAVERVGCLLSWTSGRGELGTPDDEPLQAFNWLRDAVKGTYAPHIDAENQPAYELSTLLYLSTAGADFSGGLFAFNDVDADRLVVPHAGRLLAFCSGHRNLHQVRPVRAGDRFVLSTWYRRAVGC